MSNFDTLNNRIISNSVAISKPAAQSVSVPKKTAPAKAVQIQSNEKLNGAQIFAGATALAAIVIGGIAIYKGKGNKLTEAGEDLSKKAQETLNDTAKKAEETVEEIIEESVNNAASSAAVKKDKYADLPELIADIKRKSDFDRELRIQSKTDYEIQMGRRDSVPDEQKYNRPSQVEKPEDIHIEMTKDRRFTREEATAVADFQKNPEINYYLRNGVEDFAEKEHVEMLKKIIEESQPLEQDVVVYYGLRTKKMDASGELEEFARDLKENGIIENKGFLATCRMYGDLMASFDAANFHYPKNAGYAVRLKVPKGAKGIDCRRYTGKDLSNGGNAEFIFEPGTQVKITKIDEDSLIMEGELIFPEKLSA